MEQRVAPAVWCTAAESDVGETDHVTTLETRAAMRYPEASAEKRSGKK